jgi:malate/lactate dehydrogenase
VEPLNIVTVGKNPETGEIMRDFLKDGKFPRLAHIKTDVFSLVDKHRTPIDEERVMREHPDIVFVDYLSANKRNCINLVTALYKKNPLLPIILISEELKIKSVRNEVLRLQNEKIVQALIEKPIHSPGTLEEVLVANIRKPISIGIIGLGNFGFGLLKSFLNADFVSSVKGFSERRIQEYDNIYRICEQPAMPSLTGRLNLEPTLEAVLSQTDCIAICTSEEYGESKNKVAARPDRLDLLEKEGPKIYRYCDRIARQKYPGLVVIFSNPIGANLELARAAGLEAEQVTSPFNLDAERLRKALKGYCSPANINNLIELGSSSIDIYGEHGAGMDFMPELMGTQNGESHIEDNWFIQYARKLVHFGVSKAKEIGAEAMKASTEAGFRYFEPQERAMQFFREISALRNQPSHSAYCLHDFGGVSSFLAFPVIMSYSPNPRVALNKKRMKNADWDAITGRFRQYLKDCREHVDKCLAKARGS